jgi:hypothetical protein
MGNEQSSSSHTTNTSRLPRVIDSIASKYILTESFEDMKKLEDKKYCNKLIILTSDIIADRLSDLEVQYLNQRMKKGNIIDEMAKDKVIFLKDASLKKMDIQNSIKKRRVCIGISKFYIKIAHLFAAIVGTINPIYSYKNDLGQIEKVPFMKKKSIPSSFKNSAKISKIGLCTKRIGAIMAQQLKDVETNEDIYELSSRVCHLNNKKKRKDASYDKSTPSLSLPPKEASDIVKPVVEPVANSVPNIPSINHKVVSEVKKVKSDITSHVSTLIGGNIDSASATTKSLMDEPGIPELKQLYIDIFNYNTGKFTGMSKESKEQYTKDLSLFYKTFTGQSKIPSNIKNFSDIKLKDYSSYPGCKGTDSPFKQKYKGAIKDALFQRYAIQMKKMTENTKKHQDSLLEVLDELFVYRIDPETKNKEITIHPSLTEKKLQKLVDKTRNYIVRLYIGCENDFLQVLKIFEAIIEKQIRETTQRKISNLKQQEEKTLSGI